jgi:hypothetical protein
MEQLMRLQTEYLETKRCLAFPLSINELVRLKENSEIIRAEARTLAAKLNIPFGWFTEE